MLRQSSKYLLTTLGLAASFLISGNAWAETSKQEFTAISKIVSLSHNVPAGDVEFAVVYDPKSASSVADKDAIKALIGEKFKAPKHVFKFKEVPASEISGNASPILFMTEGLDEALQKSILDEAKSSKSLTLTTAIPYVESGNCVIGVDVGSTVKIIMHGGAYKRSKLKFDAAFEFMVKEI